MGTSNSCLNCNKDDNRTGKPCPTRPGCFTPDYKNWEAIAEVNTENPEWGIISFLWDKSDDHLIINLKNNASGVIMVTLSPDDIAKLGLNY